jgi:hypothetical protein
VLFNILNHSYGQVDVWSGLEDNINPVYVDRYGQCYECYEITTNFTPPDVNEDTCFNENEHELESIQEEWDNWIQRNSDTQYYPEQIPRYSPDGPSQETVLEAPRFIRWQTVKKKRRKRKTLAPQTMADQATTEAQTMTTSTRHQFLSRDELPDFKRW